MTDDPVRIGIIGDFDPNFSPHPATDVAIRYGATRLGLDSRVVWLATTTLEEADSRAVRAFDALWCAPGSPYESLAGALHAVRVAREARIPFIGTCGGFQHAVLEYARNVLGFSHAQHAEYDPYASDLFISELECSLAGQTMSVRIEPGSRTHGCYERLEIEEQYYCDFGLDPEHQSSIHERGLRVVGVDQDGEARIVEIPEHPFFIATLFVPQLTSSERQPHPLIVAFLEAAARGAD